MPPQTLGGLWGKAGAIGTWEKGEGRQEEKEGFCIAPRYTVLELPLVQKPTPSVHNILVIISITSPMSNRNIRPHQTLLVFTNR